MEQVRLGSLLKPLGLGLATMALLGTGFVAGRLSAQPQPGEASQTQRGVRFQAVQFDQQQLLPAPDPRELIPLQPGPGQPQPGQGQGEECPILIYQDGQLFRFDLPGQQMPGPGGSMPGPGRPGGSPELIPLDPSTPYIPSPPTPPMPAPAPTPPESNPDQSI
ncbi:hypothetical protein [Meiothermus sp.]|uniref:hypothetical protein n=1 Tax=Meiothermus sp. TaxID=1955249 RepID=UPI00262EB106|nr:hypothetical protein [Meiothermus sp.]